MQQNSVVKIMCRTVPDSKRIKIKKIQCPQSFFVNFTFLFFFFLMAGQPIPYRINDTYIGGDQTLHRQIFRWKWGRLRNEKYFSTLVTDYSLLHHLLKTNIFSFQTSINLHHYQFQNGMEQLEISERLPSSTNSERNNICQK